MRRTAFTLTELMVSIVIIAILSSVALYAMASVQTQAQVQRTKAQIKRIHELIAIEWESFEDRSMRLTYTNTMPRARARLYALREQMKLEMPDRVSDVLGSTYDGLTLQPRGREERFGYKPFVPPLSFRFYRARATDSWTFQHQGAECLYLILSRTQIGDVSALESFSEREIGDTDGDGMPEILDAWGRPLQFIRWAPGFKGPSGTEGSFAVFQTGDTEAGADAFDYLNADPRAADNDPLNNTFAIFPLIFSNGPDGEANILRDYKTTSVNYGGGDQLTIQFSQTLSGRYNGFCPNDPYVWIPDTQDLNPDEDLLRLGAVINPNLDGHKDNIYNHFIETSTR